jgi:hypothetical protein
MFDNLVICTWFDLFPSAFELAEGIIKEPDTGVRPIASPLPTVVLEIGDSETLTQLRVDARLWLESENTMRVVTSYHFFLVSFSRSQDPPGTVGHPPFN